MGRWSQRTRAGGGNSLNFMVFVDSVNEFDIEVNFKNATSVALLQNTDFETVPDQLVPATLSPAGDSLVELNFPGEYADQTGIKYVGSLPSILTGQERSFDA